MSVALSTVFEGSGSYKNGVDEPVVPKIYATHEEGGSGKL